MSWRWFSFTLDKVNGLYKDNRKLKPNKKMEKLVDQLFLSGDSLCCLVTTAKVSDANDLHKVLAALKGSSNPFLCTPSQIRRLHGATNKILNLIHTSDSPCKTKQESKLFFDNFNFERGRGISKLLLESEKRNAFLSTSAFFVANKIKKQ